MQVEHNTAVSATSHGYEEQLRFQAAQHDFEEVSGMKNWNHWWMRGKNVVFSDFKIKR